MYVSPIDQLGLRGERLPDSDFMKGYATGSGPHTGHYASLLNPQKDYHSNPGDPLSQNLLSGGNYKNHLTNTDSLKGDVNPLLPARENSDHEIMRAIMVHREL